MKSKERYWLLLIGFSLGVATLIIAQPILRLLLGDKEVKVPEIAGQAVPAQLHQIDFSKRYDFICTSYQGDPLIYRNCRIVGFTGRRDGTSKLDYLSSDYFDKWLVIEMPDTRHAYLPPNEIRAFEESKK